MRIQLSRRRQGLVVRSWMFDGVWSGEVGPPRQGAVGDEGGLMSSTMERDGTQGDVQDRLKKLEEGLAVAETAQAGAQATQAAAQAGVAASVVSGAAGLVVGMLLALLMVIAARD
jgi:hypothetical protein